jgi:hypothetical protein
MLVASCATTSRLRGFYKLDGDTLTSCVAEPRKDRRSELASKPGTGQTLRVFKRGNASSQPAKRARAD